MSSKSEMIAARDNYIGMIKTELLGPGSEVSIPDKEHEIISNSPEKHYSVGILFPRENKMNADNDNADRAETSVEGTEGEFVEEAPDEKEESVETGQATPVTAADEENLDEEIGLSAQNMPSSVGITFFVKGSADKVYCNISFGTYKRTTAENCRVPFCPENPEIYEVPSVASGDIGYNKENKVLFLKTGGFDRKKAREINEKIDDDQFGFVSCMYRLADQLQKGYYRKPHKLNVCLDFGNSEYIDKNKKLDGTEAKITALKRKIRENIYSITIMLVNDDDEKADGENCIFQPEIHIESSENDFVFCEYSGYANFDVLDDEEKSLELQYRNKRVFATGLGTSANWDIDEEGNGCLYNDFFPEVEVPSMDFNMPTDSDVSSTAFSMKHLSDLDKSSKEEKLSELHSVIDTYGKWIKEKRDEIETLEEKYHAIAYKNIDGCEASYHRMLKGLETLANDKIAWDAFALANRAMYMQRIHIILQEKTSDKDRFDGDEELKGYIDAIKSDYCNADGLDIMQNEYFSWRPFQLAFIVMSINSIVDENCADRDIVDLIWFPTGGGKTEAYLGLTAMTIFYRRMKYPAEAGGTAVIMRYTLRLLAAQQFTRASTLICACESIRLDATGRRPKYGKYELGNEQITIGLWIGREHTPNKNVDAKHHLDKLLKADRSNLKYEKNNNNKFQVLKCPWCGTKLVKEENPSGKGLIGNFGYRMHNKSHFKMACTNLDCDFNADLPIQIVDQELYNNPPTLLFGTVDKFAMLPWMNEVGAFFGVGTNNRAPELIIQDELHLISGPLGTVVGLYETIVDTLCKQKGSNAKIVASTATIRRAKEQCSALYNRDVAQFPHPGLDAEDSFFARESVIDYKKEVYGRKYVGLMPSGKTKAMMEVRSIGALMQSIHDMDIADDIKDKYWTLTVYFNSLKDLGKCMTLVSDDVTSYIRTMATRAGRKNAIRYIYGIDELTSRVSTTELNETLDKLEKKTYSADDENKNRGVSSILLATNMISVGIDVARLNVMLMVGQSKLTSEYIQASSRIGRSFPGVAFAMYDGSKSRDRSHYEQFKSYHESFYKHVEPTGATPFSKPARDRALHAVAIAMMRYMVPELNEEDSAGEFIVSKYRDQIDVIKNIIVQRNKEISNRLNTHMEDESQIVSAEIENVFEQWETFASKKEQQSFTYGYKYMVNNPEKGNGRLLKAFNTAEYDHEAFDTMTSMRNVDSAVRGNVLIWED